MSDITKELLHLVDGLLERVRGEVLANLAYGTEDEGPIGGKADIGKKIEKIADVLRHAVPIITYALRIAQSEPEPERIVGRLFGVDDLLWFTGEDGDENGEVQTVAFGDIRQAWRPLPPGPAYKIEFLPMAVEDFPEPFDPNKWGPVQ